MSDKLKVTRERNYSAHHKLIGAARIAVESAIKREPGWSYAVIVGISLCGLAVEAICNAIGDRVVPEWDDFEPAPPKAKLRVICQALNIKYDKDGEPWKTLSWVIKMRNKLAHAKPEIIKAEHVWSREEYELYRHDQPISKLETHLTIKNAEIALNATDHMLLMLSQAVPLDKRIGLYSDAWHGHASLLAEHVPPKKAAKNGHKKKPKKA